MSKKKNFGWDYLNSDEFDGSYKDSKGNRGYKYSDGSGSWEGADGSHGFKYSDGSCSYYGADGSNGYIYSDGTGYFNAADGSVKHIEPGDEDDDDKYGKAFETGAKIASGLAGFAAGAMASSSSEKTKKWDIDWNILFLFGGFFLFIIIIVYLVVPKLGKYEIKMPSNAKDYFLENYKVVKKEFEDLGFEKIKCIPEEVKSRNLLDLKNKVFEVSIAGNTEFETGDVVSIKEKVIIRYYSY